MTTYTEQDVAAMVQRLVDGSSYRRAAKTLGVSPTYVRGVCEGTIRPGEKVTDGLGLKRLDARWVRVRSLPTPRGTTR